jgi:peptide chain release factor subunit 1
MATASSDADQNEIQLWEMKKLIKKLDAYKGNGTSMITVYIPQNSQI